MGVKKNWNRLDLISSRNRVSPSREEDTELVSLIYTDFKRRYPRTPNIDRFIPRVGRIKLGQNL